MRRLIAVLVTLILISTQLALAQAFVCSELMHRESGPDHCASSAGQQAVHCPGGSSCEQMCRMAEEEIPAPPQENALKGPLPELLKAPNLSADLRDYHQLHADLLGRTSRFVVSPNPASEIILLKQSLLI